MEAIVETKGSIRFPEAVLERLSLREGDAVRCHVENHTLYMTPESSLHSAGFPPVGRILCRLLRDLLPLLQGNAAEYPKQKRGGAAGAPAL